MENLHEQIKAYIPKLEYSIREYMRNPATPNAAQGIMAMVECLNMLKGAEESICTGREMTKADAEAWAYFSSGDYQLCAQREDFDGVRGIQPFARTRKDRAVRGDFFARAHEKDIARDDLRDIRVDEIIARL